MPRVLSGVFLALLFTAAASADPRLELPAFPAGAQVYDYPGYTLQYDERFEQAAWVAYELTADEVYGNAAARTNKFLPDPSIQTGSATAEDYAKSGYDRGHLAPAADMKFSEEAMRDCFYYSNMSPQAPSFNRGIWGDLEEMVRYWAVANGAVFVVTGPVLDKQDYPRIGPHKVAVPERFFKVILDYREPEIKAVAIILNNSADAQTIPASVCSVDEAERITGLDFFPNLPDPEEQRLESTIDPKLWPFVRFSLQKFPRPALTTP
jgi:endonuclease G